MVKDREAWRAAVHAAGVGHDKRPDNSRPLMGEQTEAKSTPTFITHGKKNVLNSIGTITDASEITEPGSDSSSNWERRINTARVFGDVRTSVVRM